MNGNTKDKESAGKPCASQPPANALDCKCCDPVTFRTLARADVPGFIRGTSVEKKGRSYLLFQLDGLLTAVDCAERGLVRLFPRLVGALSRAVVSIDEYMIDAAFVPFVKERLYCSPDGSVAGLVCLPPEGCLRSTNDARELVAEVAGLFVSAGGLPPDLRALATYITERPDKGAMLKSLAALCDCVAEPSISPVLLDCCKGKIYLLDKTVETLGRDRALCTLCIEERPCVSRRHARIEKKEGVWYYLDPGSSNGSSINGKQCRNNVAVALKDGDRIRAADADLVFFC